jgi:hypothetical protein
MMAGAERQAEGGWQSAAPMARREASVPSPLLSGRGFLRSAERAWLEKSCVYFENFQAIYKGETSTHPREFFKKAYNPVEKNPENGP